MPIYEYRCEDCKKISEVLVSASQGNSLKCCYCGSSRLEKIISSNFAVSKGKSGSASDASCCGATNPCDSPKKCCGG